jgi:hypothetical protein
VAWGSGGGGSGPSAGNPQGAGGGAGGYFRGRITSPAASYAYTCGNQGPGGGTGGAGAQGVIVVTAYF